MNTTDGEEDEEDLDDELQVQPGHAVRKQMLIDNFNYLLERNGIAWCTKEKATVYQR